MEETDLSSLNEQEIMDMYSNVIEGGEQVIIAKCKSGYHEMPGSSYYTIICCKDNAPMTGNCYQP